MGMSKLGYWLVYMIQILGQLTLKYCIRYIIEVNRNTNIFSISISCRTKIANNLKKLKTSSNNIPLISKLSTLHKPMKTPMDNTDTTDNAIFTCFAGLLLPERK